MHEGVELLQVAGHHGHKQHVDGVRAKEAETEKRAVVRGERLEGIA